MLKYNNVNLRGKTMKLFRSKKQDDIEDMLLGQTLQETFDFLHAKMDEKEMPVRLGIMYQDVLFKITCEPVTDELKKEVMDEFMGNNKDDS